MLAYSLKVKCAMLINKDAFLVIEAMDKSNSEAALEVTVCMCCVNTCTVYVCLCVCCQCI